jgi:hypothetical protein
MPPLTLRRKTAILALAMALALPWVAVAAPQARHQPTSPGLLHQIWAAFTSIWGTGVTPDDGCRMDPDGRCLRGSAAPAPAINPDDGCRMDPSGGCLPGH